MFQDDWLNVPPIVMRKRSRKIMRLMRLVFGVFGVFALEDPSGLGRLCLEGPTLLPYIFYSRNRWGLQYYLDIYVPWSKVAILGMVIPPLIGILIMGI